MSIHLTWRWTLLLVGLAGGLGLGCRREPEATDAAIRQRQGRVEGMIQSRMRWHTTNLISAYLTVGHHDPAWDVAVTNALHLIARARANRNVDPDWRDQILSHLRAAKAQGCRDPYVDYAAYRYTVADPAEFDLEQTRGLVPLAAALRGSEYPPDLRFWSALNVAVALKRHFTNSVEILEYRDSAATQLSQALLNPEFPPLEAYVSANYLFAAVTRNDQQRRQFWRRIEGPLMQNFGGTAYAHVLKGGRAYEEAWALRGGGFADTVTAAGWKGFEENLRVAQREFDHAWELDPALADTTEWMLKLCTSLSKPRKEMEKWFARAMKLKPDNTEACGLKIWYLLPRWHGSVEDMIEFGRTCITNAQYTGNVPLTIMDVYSHLHRYAQSDAEREAIYQEPTVWEDARAAVAEMQRRHPDETWFYNNLAWYAWKCRRWEELTAAIERIRKPNYGYFGGREEYEAMLEAARQHRRPK